MTIDVVGALVSTLVGGIAGYAAAIVTFKTRLALTEQATEQRREKDNDRFSDLERRQRITLQLVADVAKKVGADARFSDALVRYLAEQEPE